MSRELHIVGVMSGTSIDALDCALCRCLPDRVRLDHLWSRPFPPTLRRRLHAAASGAASSWDAAQLHHDFSRFCAGAIGDGLGRRRIDAIGFHGQTVFHQPKAPHAATWQLGEPAWIAEAIGVPVVSNFRAADLAAGGQGAPLASLFHKVAFGRPGSWTAVQNLGGIGNVTLIDWRHARRRPLLLAFDTGPANVLLDLACRRVTDGRAGFDRDGRLAASGQIDARRVRSWLRHPFIRRAPPKSTGRELFGEPFLERILADWPEALANGGRDLLASLAEFTALSVAENYRRHLPPPPCPASTRVILAGGGGSNPVLVNRLRAALGGILPVAEVSSSEDAGWPRQAIEPAAFALLAAYRLWRLPGNLPETTGASGPRLLGQITE